MSLTEPYGELVESTVRIATWNVWGRFGPHEQRFELIVETLRQHEVDIVVLQETWTAPDGTSQPELLGRELGLEHSFVGSPGPDFGGWHVASGMVSRWPILDPQHFAFSTPEELKGWPGEAVAGTVDGPRGQIPVMGVSLDWPPQASAIRQASVHDLARRCRDLAGAKSYPVVVGGDFNAGPDSAELRSLTGQDAPVLPNFVLFDSWAKAGVGRGITWDRENRWAAPTLLPSQRIDHILTGWPQMPGGGGDVVEAGLLGTDHENCPPSDHYGVRAVLRY